MWKTSPHYCSILLSFPPIPNQSCVQSQYWGNSQMMTCDSVWMRWADLKVFTDKPLLLNLFLALMRMWWSNYIDCTIWEDAVAERGVTQAQIWPLTPPPPSLDWGWDQKGKKIIGQSSNEAGFWPSCKLSCCDLAFYSPNNKFLCECVHIFLSCNCLLEKKKHWIKWIC